MAENTIRWDQDADGIVTLTLDDPTQRANTMTDNFRSSLADAVDRLESEKDSITGVIVTSAKDTFFAGGDLKLLAQVTPENAAEFAEGVTKIKADFRRLEKLGKPTVAALNGAALGGGLEIALACNHRIALDNPKSQFGLPEVTLGLLPGAGGVTRVIRLLGIADGLMKVLLQGTRYKPAEAVELGLVHELAATPDELLDKAREWIRANPETSQPWDDKGYRMPGGAPEQPEARRHAAGLPRQPEEAAQGRADARAAPHHVRGRRGRERRLRHGAADRGPLLRQPRHRPGREEHDPGVLVRPERDQRRRFAPGRVREAQRREGRRARRRHDGRRHRLRQRPQRDAGRAQGRLDRGGREGQGVLAEDPRQGRVAREDGSGQGRRGAGPHHPDRRLRRSRRLRPHRRGRLREGVAQARGLRRGREGRRPRRAARVEHLDAADHEPGRGRRAQAGLRRPALLLPRRQDAAAGDHPR